MNYWAKKIALDVGVLAESYYEEVWRFCYRRVGKHLVDDATQQVFLSAQKSAISFRGDSEPKTWLLGIAANTCSNVLRKAKQAPFEQILDPESSFDPSNDLTQKIVLQQALLKLSEDQKTIIVLHEIEGYTQQEIAVILNIQPGTVKSRLFYSLKALKNELGESQ